MNENEEIVSKGEFARLINVTPGRVSQYISEKKISGDALVGDGRKAKIRVEVAKAQLRRFIDIGQRFGNGIDTCLDGPAVPLGEATETAAAPGAIFEPGLTLGAPEGQETIEDRIKREKLEGLQRANRKLAEEEAARAGRYVLAEDAARSMGRIAAQQIAWFEGVLSEIATEVSAKYSLPQRDVLHTMRSAFRECRERGAAKFQAEADRLPAAIEDTDLPEADAAAIDP